MSSDRAASDGTRAPGPAGTQYRERLSAPWWWYPIGVVIAVILASEFHVADQSLTVWVPMVVIIAFAVAVVWSAGRASVRVADGSLFVRDARLPVDVVADTVTLDRETVRLVVGRHGDPAAFCAVRPWVGPALQLGLDDPDDPTPYWVVSTRHPERLSAAIRAARSAGTE